MTSKTAQQFLNVFTAWMDAKGNEVLPAKLLFDMACVNHEHELKSLFQRVARPAGDVK